MILRNCMNDSRFSEISSGVDLNQLLTSGLLQETVSLRHLHVCRQNPVRAADGFSPLDHLHQNRRSLRWQLPCSQSLLYRSVSSVGFRPVDLSGKSSRYRSLPYRTICEALSHGDSLSDKAFDIGRRKRAPRLENLRRLRSTADCSSSKIIRRGRFQPGAFRYGLRAGLDDHRSVPVSFPLGTISKHKGGDQIAYPARPARQYTEFYSYLRWENARCSSARSDDSRAWRHLCNGSGISGFRAIVSDRPGRRIFRNTWKIESSDQAAILTQSRSFDRPNLRPDCHTDRLLFEQSLQQTFATHLIQRSRNEKDADLYNQPFCLARTDHHRTLSKSMASGIIFQMDQTTSAHQEILRYIRERGKNTDLDRRVGIRACGYCEEAPQSRPVAPNHEGPHTVKFSHRSRLAGFKHP
jgi:hypothetical protein